MLMRKYVMLKALSSNFFINRSLGLMNLSYKLFGIRLTNMIISTTMGDVLTSGQTISSLLIDIEHHRQKHIGALSGYCIEALEHMDNKKIRESLDIMCDTIKAQN